MTHSWKELSTNREADEYLVSFFCKRGAADKDPSKPTRPVLFNILQKYIVIAGALKIMKIEDGVPFFEQGSGTGEMTNVHRHSSNVPQETDDDRRETDHDRREMAVNNNLTLTQEKIANAKRANMAYKRTTRIAQKKTQEAAQAVQKVAQDALLDS
jgi:hypothetical protein